MKQYIFVFCFILCLYAFEPLTKDCLQIDTIDHCCKCSGVKQTTYVNLKGITPETEPLPRSVENIGTSLCTYKNRAVFDNHPDFEEDQEIGEDTLVHVMEYNPNLNIWQHMAILDTPAGEGHTLSCSENYVLIGNPASYPASSELFVRTENPQWSLSMKIKEVNENSEFGYAVAINEESEVVMVSDPSYRNDIGRVYVYPSYSDIIIDTLDHPLDSEHSRFGHKIVITENTAVITSPYQTVESHVDVGAVHIFQREASGSKWYFLQSLYSPQQVASNTERKFGWSVAISGDFIAVGSYYSDFVEVYRLTDEWRHFQTIQGPRLTLISKFGASLDLKGTRLAVSDYNFLSSPSALGKVFTYEYSAVYDEWLPCQTFTDSPTTFHTHFGQSVSLMSETQIVMAAPATDSTENSNGRIYLYDLDRQELCEGCDGIINSDADYDECGVCDGDNSSCSGCDGIVNSGVTLDYCGVCGGQNTTCLSTEHELMMNNKCNQQTQIILQHEPQNNKVEWRVISEARYGTVSIVNSTLTYVSSVNEKDSTIKSDLFRIELSDHNGHFRQTTVTVEIEACVGCDGVANSGVVEDRCGVCGGNGDSCLDCNGDLNGTAFVDYCGVCSYASTANTTCLVVNSPTTPFELGCSQKFVMEAQEYNPVLPTRTISWLLVSDAEDGAVNMGVHSGRIEYSNHGSKDVDEEIWFKGTDKYYNEGIGRIKIHVRGCNIVGCDQIVGSGKTIDQCGVCGGTNECIDCNGVVFGNAKTDICGVCDGKNDTCPDKLILMEYNEKIRKNEINRNIQAEGTGIPILLIILLAVFAVCFFAGIVGFLVYSGIAASSGIRRNPRQQQTSNYIMKRNN